MKKKIFLVGLVALLGAGGFFMSCKKVLTCSCYTSDSVSQSTFQKDLDEVMKSLNALTDDCDDVEYKLKHSYGYSRVNCS